MSAVGMGVAPWIFIHDTDKVEKGLMVLFFGLFFVALPPSWKFFCRRPWLHVDVERVCKIVDFITRDTRMNSQSEVKLIIRSMTYLKVLDSF